MGNDVPVEHQYNIAKYANYGLSANIDKIATDVVVKHKTSSVTNIVFDKDADNAKLIITPNPATDVVYISGGEQATEAAIYSLSGAVVKRVSLADGGSVNVSDLTKGNYIVKVSTSAGNTLVGKLLKK
jgi:hypothetical protein